VLGPVAHHLHDRTIVLALDGALQYVPFAVLPLGDGAGATAPLVASHEVVAVPSMSALAAAPRASASATKTLALFADPVLETSDPRFAAGRAPHVAAAVLPPRGGARNLGRLLSTGYEAEAIAALVPAEQRLVARGFAANRAAVLGADLRDYRYVHFATHGVVDARYPGLSALALSQFDDAGAPQDGFLRLHDIFDLKLAADVVVLSACETALGRDVRGEGLIGLTQGFMYAGARSLVASLWQVPDRATAELMSRFYGYLLNDGLAPSEALRRAQTSLAAELRFRDPFFWGGFVLLGDWR
jgi:CHAT domain-containing protein